MRWRSTPCTDEDIEEEIEALTQHLGYILLSQHDILDRLRNLRNEQTSRREAQRASPQGSCSTETDEGASPGG